MGLVPPGFVAFQPGSVRAQRCRPNRRAGPQRLRVVHL